MRNEAVSLLGVPVFLIVSRDADKLVQAWRAAGHSDEKPALSLSYQDKKPVISLIHSVSLELLQADLPLGCTPHLSRRWKDPVKQNGGGKLLALIILAVENTWNKLSWEQTKEDTLHQGRFSFPFFTIRSCTLNIYMTAHQHITYSGCARQFFRDRK